MDRKLAFEVAIVISVAAMLSYFYGLSNGVQTGLQLGSAEANKYKDLFLVDPVNNQFTITQTFVGTLKNAGVDVLLVSINGKDVTLPTRLNRTYIYDCKGNLNIEPDIPPCEYKKDGIDMKTLINTNIRIQVMRLGSDTYKAFVISY